MLLLDQYQLKYWDFAFALINAAMITKVIMIGEYARLGRMHEDKSLLVSTVWKAFVFGLLVFAFHVVEDVIKRLIHGADVAKAAGEIRAGGGKFWRRIDQPGRSRRFEVLPALQASVDLQPDQ